MRLQNYLHRKPFTYPEDKIGISEAILLVYNFFEWAIRDNCPIVEITKSSITRKSMNGNFEKSLSPTPIDFRPKFAKVIKFDEVINAHVTLVEETPEKTVYRLNI